MLIRVKKKRLMFWTLWLLLPFIVKFQFGWRIKCQPSAGNYPKSSPPFFPLKVTELYIVLSPPISVFHKPLMCSKLRMLVLVSNSSNWPFSTVTLSPSCGTLSGNQLWGLDHLRQNCKDKLPWKTRVLLFLFCFREREYGWSKWKLLKLKSIEI